MFALNENNSTIGLRRSPRFMDKTETPKMKGSITPNAPIKKQKTQSNEDKKAISRNLDEDFIGEIIPEHERKFKNFRSQLVIAGRTLDDNQRNIEITKAYEIFNDNFEILKKINEPYNELKPLSVKHVKFDIMIRRLYDLSDILMIQMKYDDNSYDDDVLGINKLKLIATMNVTRDLFCAFRHLHFED
jgi:hypothetical protein